MGEDLRCLAKTLFGLEEVLEKELRQLGARDIQKVNRGVEFTGDLGFVYKSNLWLRTALRILVSIDKFQVRNEEDLYQKLKRIPWEAHFGVEKSFAFDVTLQNSFFKNSLFVAQKAKDAVADRFRNQLSERPSVDTKSPDVRINLYIFKEKVTVSLDSSGDSLHRRGYRQEVDRAPINEVLAAGILKLTGWDKLTPLIDPMCGSGTFLLEAALIAHNIPPGVFRERFSFQNWSNFDEALYKLLFDKALEKETNHYYPILGYELQHSVLRKAQANVKNALMEEQIQLQQADFFKLQAPELKKPGMLLFNPPYNIKLEAQVESLYKDIGDQLKQNWSGYTAWVFSASEAGIKKLGLRPSAKIKLLNGKLDSWLLRYDLYKGTKKF